MKRSIVSLFIIMTTAALSYGTEVQAGIKNSGLAYNGENGTYWEQTRYTLTYFEDLIQPYLRIQFNSAVEFTGGLGLLVPFDQESKIANYYPYIQTKFHFDQATLILGSLDGNHNFPPFILDPLVNLTPEIRIQTESQIPIDYEFYKYSKFSHGLYEYGLQYLWDLTIGKGEVYMNWQLADTDQHRERFDVGFIHSFDPLYIGLHYWHNGGHENPHPISITEDYSGAIGLRNATFSLLYTASYFLPDRDSRPELNTFGQAIYGEYHFRFLEWDFELQGFVSDKLLVTNHQYITIEGDPFYRVPAYLGFNFYKTISFGKEVSLKLGFVNGAFLPNPGDVFNWKMIRYDQLLKADFDYRFELVKQPINSTN